MQRELTVKDCNLGPSSDLTVVAPIIKGFVPTLDAVSYKTRVKRVLRTLHIGRSTSHEFDFARLLSDSVERVGRIQSVRIAVVEPQDVVLLCVTFDGAWESYVRVIWQKVARLLDLIFCNTEDYVNGWQNSFEDWGAWLRRRQAETSFLYATPGFAVGDAQYLRMQERLLRHRPGSAAELDRISAPAAEEIAWQLFNSGTNPTHGNMGEPLDSLLEARPALFRQGLRSLAGLFRLADVYLPNSVDGWILHRAAVELLPDFMRLIQGPMLLQPAWDRAYPRFGESLDWITRPESPEPPAARVPPALPSSPAMPPLNEVQGGIVKAYKPGGHGVLLLLAFKSPAALAKLLADWKPTSAEDQARLEVGATVANIALAPEALRVAGLSGDQMAALPVAFTMGMDRRAGLLGDVRANHPRRWRLPLRNWTQGAKAVDEGEDAPGERVAVGAVHAVLQLRLIDPSFKTPSSEARRRLLAELKRLMKLHVDLEPLSLQWMQTFPSKDGHGVVEHFGFKDGLSQPRFEAAEAGHFFKNHVHVGEALVGHAHAAEAAPRADAITPGLKPEQLAVQRSVRELLHNGSFLVVRKLRQDVAQMEAVLKEGVARSGLPRDTLLAKMMGRWPEGHAQAAKPLVPLPSGGNGPNDFLYGSDPEGRACPLHAHIRRANPRGVVPPALQAQMVDGGRPPRLIRRGMGYGPRHDPSINDEAQHQRSLQRERGLVFMAYNASLAEQFEVVQQWLSGGNSTGGYSGQPDPFLGLPEPGLVRHYRFEDESKGCPVRLALDGDSDMLAEPTPLVRLEWGGYYFAPSLPALKQLALLAEKAEQAGRPRYGWSALRGAAWIKRLQGAEQTYGAPFAREYWKSLLEDPGAAAEMWTADIWAAIRQLHGGVLRTPYAVLVGRNDLVHQTLLDAAKNLTSTEYLPRMRRSFGEIYLGLDAGQPDRRYETESEVCNQAIMARDAAATRQRAHEVVDAWLQARVAESKDFAQADEALRREGGATPRERVHWELTLEVRELIDELLAVFCEDWFGLSADAAHFQRSGQRYTWVAGERPCYPGHFMAPSRYIFQAHPGEKVREVGALHGQAMLKAMKDYLASRKHKLPKAPVSHAVLTQGPGVKDRDLAARSIIGALMGMVPTVDANLRRVCHLWLNEGTLWALRSQRDSLSPAQMGQAFVRAMLSRAAPDTLWRTVQKPHRIGGEAANAVPVAPGDLVVVGLNSATQHNLEQGIADPSPAFGGHRTKAPDLKNPHPVHACPGYGPAMAMMMGFVDALVRSDLPLRAGHAPLTLLLDGHEPFVAPGG